LSRSISKKAKKKKSDSAAQSGGHKQEVWHIHT